MLSSYAGFFRSHNVLVARDVLILINATLLGILYPGKPASPGDATVWAAPQEAPAPLHAARAPPPAPPAAGVLHEPASPPLPAPVPPGRAPRGDGPDAFGARLLQQLHRRDGVRHDMVFPQARTVKKNVCLRDRVQQLSREVQRTVKTPTHL
jgi:hypothetical protein